MINEEKKIKIIFANIYLKKELNQRLLKKYDQGYRWESIDMKKLRYMNKNPDALNSFASMFTSEVKQEKEEEKP